MHRNKYKKKLYRVKCTTSEAWPVSSNSCSGNGVSGQVYSWITGRQRAGRPVSLPFTVDTQTPALQTGRRCSTHTHSRQASLLLAAFHAVFHCLLVTSENPRCTMSPASAFAIATAAAGHASSQGRQGRAPTVPKHRSGAWKWLLRQG